MDEVIQLTQDLIRFKSMNSRPGEINRCADFIESYFKKHTIAYRRMDYNGTPSLLAIPDNNRIPVLLMSHIDVVDGPETVFNPYIKDGKLFGRGSIDDKYAAALSMVLFKTFLSRHRKNGMDQKDMPFGILITGDEEVGGYNGAKLIFNQIKPDFCIALDGGIVTKVVTREKGLLTLKLMAKGKAAHGARPWLGENAIENLFADYQILKRFFKETADGNWHRTINFSFIKAGKSFNQVPDYAEAIFDIRYTENDDIDGLYEKMSRAVKSELVIERREPMFHGGESTYLDLLLDLSDEIHVGFEHGASDARFLSDHGIKGIVWGANGDSSAHTLDEHINIDSLLKLYGLLESYMDSVAKIPFDQPSTEPVK